MRAVEDALLYPAEGKGRKSETEGLAQAILAG
jgi:hypothetical protein